MTRGERETARLLEMLREAGAPVPRGSTLHRVYASRADRTLGAWAWTVRGPDLRWLDIGSQWPRRTLLRGLVVSPITTHGETVWHVDPALVPVRRP